MSDHLDPDLLEKNPDRIRDMFGDIARRYDLANTLLTGGTDFLWRNRTAIELVRPLRKRIRAGQLQSPPVLLDACAGSMKLGHRIRHHLNGNGHLVGTDFCIPLLKQGREWDPDEHTDRVAGDVLQLPFRTSSVDAVSIGFGYRNLEDRARGLRELHRVLRPHGLLAILEFHMPPPSLIQHLYMLYFDNVLPAIGNLIAGTDTGAYNYLNESVRAFPAPDVIKEEFTSNAYRILQHRPMMLGTVHLYVLSAEPNMQK
jgi:demethylmenaquinone methyltransferase/2-methoxy-6-polyprenyl-1,4-benzoquinol methylase